MPVRLGLRNVRSRPDTTPALIDPYSPNGLPTTNASLPMRMAPGLPSVAGTIVGGQRVALEHGDVVLLAPAATIVAVDVEPSANVTVIVVASSTTWSAVRMSPFG